MRDAESVPEHDVRILNGLVAGVCDPLRQTLGRFTGSLRHVAACRMDLIVCVCLCKRIQISTAAVKSKNQTAGDLHFVTWTACLAKPARFHTKPPSLGSNFGTSLLTSL